MKSSARLALACILCAVAFGCSSSTTATEDTGTGITLPDAGGGTDSGISVVTDTGPSNTPDLGEPPPPMDAGPRPDAGPRGDAGPLPDVGSLLPPAPDAGSIFGDSGAALGDPAWVDLQILTDGTMCEPLTACGGELGGTWDTTGGCFAVAVPTQITQLCPGARFSGSGRARGRVTFANGIARRQAQTEVTVDLFVPGSCAGFIGGCPGLQTQIRRALPDAVCVGTGDCRCQARTVNTIDDGDQYTTANNQIVSSNSPKRWNYCVSGTSFRYEDVTPGMAAQREPGIITFGRR